VKYKNVIITGGLGFIGSHLVDLLVKKNYNITVIDNFCSGTLKNLERVKNKIKLVKSDVSTIKNSNPIFKNCSAIIHLAGIGDIVPSIENPKKYFNTNFMGTLNILEAMRYNKINKIIYAASSSCYGIAKTPTNEQNQINCEYPYALSKFMGEELIKHWSKVYKLNYTSLRIFNAFGERYKTKGAYGSVIGVFMKQMLSSEPLTVVGSGKQKRDFVYVTDVAYAFYLALKSNKKNKVYNLASAKPISVNQLIKNLRYKHIIKIPTRKKEPFKTFADINKIKRELKWRPKISFANGIKIMMTNKNYWLNAPLWTPKKIKKATELWHKYMK
jgi:UDP-glucose 4-epimerase